MKTLKLIISLWCLLFTGIAQQAYAVAETEPNNTWNQANVITLGAAGTGTAGLAQNQDWWRVTSATDGMLTINYTATNGMYVRCEVYDTLGSPAIATGSSTSGTTSFNADGLKAGTYYILLFAYYTTEAPNYSFTPTWTTPAQANDMEPNQTKATAQVLPLNGSTTGHVGYFYKNQRDTIDWYKLTTNKDGRIDWTLTSANGNYVWAVLYDNDGVTPLHALNTYTTGTATWSADGLAIGTYYIAVYCYYNNQFAPYTLSNSLVLPAVVADAEPNGTRAQALNINLGDSAVGHVNYYYNHLRDTADWYKVTTTLDGQLNYSIQSYSGSYIWVRLYDNDGVTPLHAANTYTTGFGNWSDDGLAAGTYYLKVYSYYDNDFEPYKLKVSQTIPPVTIDTEPNGTKALETTLMPNDSVTGHTGYYYNQVRDSFDWRKITITSNGKLDWTLSSQNGNYVWAILYDNNGTTPLYALNTYTTSTATWSVDGLAPGTYYMLVYIYYNYQFAPYYLKTKFTPAGNDAEPNGTKALAKTKVLNDSLLGTIGYYYNGVRDTNDWFKITTTNDGQLSIKLYPFSGSFTYLTVYDNNGTTVLYNQYAPSGVLDFTRNDLGKGTYYIKVRCYYDYQFSSYALVTKFVSAGTNDVEPNNFAAKGTLAGGYATKTGNIGYYYKLATDVVDWYRFDYTAAVSTLNVVLTKKIHTFDTNYPDLLYRLYKDTTLAPIDSVQLVGGSTLTSNRTYSTLTTATYYVRITPLNGTIGAYTLKGTYRDTASQTVTNVLLTADSVCGNGKLSYLVRQGLSPYSVQLYRDNVALGAPIITNDTAKFTGLAPGRYFARAKGTGAATFFKASTTISLLPTVAGVNASAIMGTTANISWNALACQDGYLLGYKKSTVATYTTDTVYTNSKMLSALSKSTIYNYRVASFHRLGSVVYVSAYSAVRNFTTLAVRLGDNEPTATESNLLSVYPNPSAGLFTIDLSNFKFTEANINIYDLQGRLISSENINSENELIHTIDLSTLENGVYIMTINSESGIQSVRLIKE